MNLFQEHHNSWRLIWSVITFLFLSFLYTPIAIVFYIVGFPLWLIGVCLLVFFVFEYRAGVKQAIKKVPTKEIPENTEIGKEIHQRTERVCEELGVEKPKLYYGNMGGPNAFATGRKGNGHIVLSTSLVEFLTLEETEAVIAHEVSHLKSRDVFPLIFGEGTAVILGLLIHKLTLMLPGDASQRNDLGNGFARIIHSIIFVFIYPVSRHREYIADLDSARAMGDWRPLYSALRKQREGYDSGSFEQPDNDIAALCIESGSLSMSFKRIFATHPKLEDRLTFLQTKGEEITKDDTKHR